MLRLIHGPVPSPDTALRVVELRTDRHHLAKRIWRGVAADGEVFGFELDAPLSPGSTFFQTESVRYVLEQELELVLEIPLDLAPVAAAGVGWAIGNLHLELMGEPHRLLTPDDKSARKLLDRLQVPYRSTSAVFRPGRFARAASGAPGGVTAQELGQSHQHTASLPTP